MKTHSAGAPDLASPWSPTSSGAKDEGKFSDDEENGASDMSSSSDEDDNAVPTLKALGCNCAVAASGVLFDIVIFLASMWIVVGLGWLVLVAYAGFNMKPSCGSACRDTTRRDEVLFWQRTNAVDWYLSFFCASFFAAIVSASWRWLGKANPLLVFAQFILIVVATPIVLNQGFFQPWTDNFASASYIDYDPSAAASDLAVPHLLLTNGTSVSLSKDNVLLIGNGPLSAEQRKFIRAADAEMIYRFNGMVNLLPDEKVGHLFTRRVEDASARQTGIGEYWGLKPPSRFLGLVEWAYSPRMISDNILSMRTMCARMPEALDVSLLFGKDDDADWYTYSLDIPVHVSRVQGEYLEKLLLERGLPEEQLEFVLSGNSCSSGFLGLLEVLERAPNATIHILGMNFADSPGNHPRSIEHKLTTALQESGQLYIHVPPSQLYHAEKVMNTFMFHDKRVQGARCGEWNPWWFPQWRFCGISKAFPRARLVCFLSETPSLPLNNVSKAGVA